LGSFTRASGDNVPGQRRDLSSDVALPGTAPASPPASFPPIEVAAGVIFRHDRLLITQRRAGDHLGGLWEFPGGKREPGETYEACLARELEEELGVRVRVGEGLSSVTHQYPAKIVHLRFFRCTLERGEPEPLGCAALAWITREELSRYAFPEADVPLVKLLNERLDLWKG
jgi:mutator protein MutT